MKYSFPAFENGFIRAAAASPALRVADCTYNADQIIGVMREYEMCIRDRTEDDAALLGHIYAVIAQLCKKLGVDESGYRVVTNVGADGGQSVKHLHFHVLAKRSLCLLYTSRCV